MMQHLHQFICRLMGSPCASGMSSTSELLRDMEEAESKAEAETIVLRNQRHKDQRDRGADMLLALTEFDEKDKP